MTPIDAIIRHFQAEADKAADRSNQQMHRIYFRLLRKAEEVKAELERLKRKDEK